MTAEQICHGSMKMPRGTLRLGYCHAKLKDTIMDIKVKAVLWKRLMGIKQRNTSCEPTIDMQK